MTVKEQKALLKAALAVAKKYPVFPTIDKRPAWSNRELGVSKGKGGFHIASKDPEVVKRLFNHVDAVEIAVPMGEMSGLICVDVDTYKDDLETGASPAAQWVIDHEEHLGRTLRHKTRSGGLHFIFKHPGNQHRFPATLAPGVDLKAAGNGYICWPGTPGYEVIGNQPIKPFPMELVAEALKRRGGSGNTKPGASFNEATDEQLIEMIRTGDELYPALRSLAYRMPGKRNPSYSQNAAVDVLREVMRASELAIKGHPDHERWQDRFGKIDDLVESAYRKQRGLDVSDFEDALLAEGPSLIPGMAMEPVELSESAEDLVDRLKTSPVAVEEDDEFVSVTPQRMLGIKLAPIDWLVEDLIPASGIVSLAGHSNVGKTRWIAGLVAACAAGATERMGLSPTERPFSSLWVANEERLEDIERRLKAVYLQHGDSHAGAAPYVRGKDGGQMRLVRLKDREMVRDDEAIERVVRAAQRADARLVVFDPYVTLSEGLSENDAASASALHEAFTIISMATGAAVLHAHHTPKDRSQDPDWYRGKEDAFRGSGAIYGNLDCAFTLSNWMPYGDPRKRWKSNMQDPALGLKRWVVLSGAKNREGDILPDTIYHLVGQEMEEGEGRPIGVCGLSGEIEAMAALDGAAVDAIKRSDLAMEIAARLGEGEHGTLTGIHKKMAGVPHWPEAKTLRDIHMEEMMELLGDGEGQPPGVCVTIEHNPSKRTAGRWIVKVS